MRRAALLSALVMLVSLGVGTGSSAQVGVPQVAVVPVPGIFALPVAIAQHPDSNDLYVVEKAGRITAVREGLVFDPVPVLNLAGQVSSDLEQGLLGLDFSPDGEYMYISFTAGSGGGSTFIWEYHLREPDLVPSPTTGDLHPHCRVGTLVGGRCLDTSTQRQILTLGQPFNNHNGGTIKFGPDGYLYIGIGDGGSANDPQNRALNPGTLLGKMLRIDPRPDGDAPYAIPEDNPFVDDDEFLPEIWAYGLRNPWKFSFDKETGDLWIADVGQGRWEEINIQHADSTGGENYGWNMMEGIEPFVSRPPAHGPAVEPEDHHPPIHVYRNNGLGSLVTGGSCSVTGGYVYRGATEWLQGAYLFSDWCQSSLRYIREDFPRNDDGVIPEGDAVDLNVNLGRAQVVGFGEDHDGEQYVVALGGLIFKIVPLPQVG